MLAPNQRQFYLDALKAPKGYSLDKAIGTTFSLDLLTLLTVPLGFALLDWGDNIKELLHDPVKLLESLRRYADRTMVFCQAGRISIPARRHPLFAHLEKSIVEVFPPPPKTGVFHPKVWLLRFTAEKEPVQYRFICLSRNLTADRSLDTILALDGELTNRQRAYSRNHPLGKFVEALPGLAKEAVSRERKTWILQMAEDVRLVDFKVPEPFEDELEFIPIGIHAGARDVLGNVEGRRLFLSPFLSADYMEQFERADSDILISRAESLDQIPEKILKKFGEVWALDEGVEEGTLDSSPPDELSGEKEFSPFSGLHAKLYIDEKGWDANVLTGSANMTSAAFNQNVEFLVRLRGKKSQVGIGKFMGGSEGGGFGNLLRRYTSPESPPDVDKDLTENMNKVSKVRSKLSRLPLMFRVSGTGGGKGFSLELLLESKYALLLEGTRVNVWPVTLGEDRSVSWLDFSQEGRALFEGVSVTALTSFLAVSVVAGEGKTLASERFVLNLPLENTPDDRMFLVLKETLSEPGVFIRYLLLLLLREQDTVGGAADLVFNDKKGIVSKAHGTDSIPLFEELIRAYSRNPSHLEAIGRLVNDLKATQGGREILPEGFEEMWDPIWAALQGGNQ